MAVPPLNPHIVMVDPETGRPTPSFIRWWQDQRVSNDLITPLRNTAEVSGVVDKIGAVHGSVLFRGGTLWETLAPGTSGYLLGTQGASSDPVWVEPTFLALTDAPSAYTGAAGQTVKVKSDESGLEFAATTSGGLTIIDKTATFSITDTQLGGDYLIACDFTSAGDITVPSGLTGTEPVEVFWASGEQPTFVAGSGVTITSKFGSRALDARGSWAKLVPSDTADEYYLWGDLTVPANLFLLETGTTDYLELEGDASSGSSYLLLEGAY